MRNHNADNERTKRSYLEFLREAKGASEATVNVHAAALSRFEAATNFRSFKTFRTEQAVAFKRRLLDSRAAQTGEPLSLSTVLHTLKALEAFFFWLAGQPGFKSVLRHSDAQYFRLAKNETAAAKAPREQHAPTVEQVHRVLELMPSASDVERRDRALIATALLTAARDGALSSAQLRHADMVENVFRNDGRTMRIKNGKTFSTWFFPVGDHVREILADWVSHLRHTLMFAETDPLFPATAVGFNRDVRRLAVNGLTRNMWTSAQPIRNVFRAAFERAGFDYPNPHSIRRTIALLGLEKHACDAEALKAWSQNMGHNSLMTTLGSYGAISPQRQAEIIRGGGSRHTMMDAAELARHLAPLLNAQRSSG